MSNPIGNIPNQLAASNLLANDAQQAGTIGKGTAANGENLTVTHQTSALSTNADIAEEISQALTKFKKFEKREVDKGKSHQDKMAELLRKIQTVEKIDGLEELTDTIIQRSNANFNQKDFLKEAEKRFPDDVFHQFVALYEAAMAYEALNGIGSGEEIFAAVDTLKRDNRQAIQIGLNLTEEAAKLSEKTGLMSIPDTRREYQDHVKDHKSLNQAYIDLNKRHGVENFETAVDIQLKLLATDLACVDKSTSGTRLKAILDDMQKLKVLVGVHDNCVETQEQISRPPFNVEIAAHEYLGSILSLIERQWITEADFSGLAKEINVSELQAKIFFMNKTAESVRMLPEEIFVNVEAKQQMVAAVQEVQDSLVMQEEGSDQPVDDKEGIIGEVNMEGIGILNDIAHQMGYDLPGVSTDNRIPDLVKGTAEAVSPDNAKVGNNADKSVANVKATESEPESYAGLSDKELVEIQDKKLTRAEEIHQLNGEKYVVDSGLDALKYARDKGPNEILNTLIKLRDQRGRSVADGLKISIIPDGATEAISLIPPKELKNLKPEELDDLVKTAIQVLETQSNDHFKNIDFNKLEEELDGLRRQILSLDINMKTKDSKRSKGEKQFYQLERKRVTFNAIGMGVTVEASRRADVMDDEDGFRIHKPKPAGKPVVNPAQRTAGN